MREICKPFGGYLVETQDARVNISMGYFVHLKKKKPQDFVNQVLYKLFTGRAKKKKKSNKSLRLHLKNQKLQCFGKSCFCSGK